MATFSFFILYLVVNLVNVECKRILVVVPTPAFSHQVVFRPVTQELAKRGHEVVIVTTDPAFPKGKTPANLTEIDFHDISYPEWRKRFLTAGRGSRGVNLNQMRVALDLLTELFEAQVKTEEFQQLLKGKPFDLLITEGWARQPLALSYVFKVPVIQMSSFGAFFDNYFLIGAPSHPLLYPMSTQQKIYNRTLWEKVVEVYKCYQFSRLLDTHEEMENEMVKRLFGPEAPTLRELSNNVDMLFLNIHPMYEGNYPVPPTVIYMGGFYPQFEKELPQDLKSYLDASKNGVVYMSFGTNTMPSQLPPEKIQLFLKVLSQLPYDVLWKWDRDEPPGESKNIKLGKWFPQSDLLKHPKIKLFITQGGLQSTEDSLKGGVPLIGIPMAGDQWYNTDKYLHFGIGAKLELGTLTEEEFNSTIHKVINDKSYRVNVKRFNTLLRDQPEPPLERAIWWIEYVLRHGGARHLRAPAANMPWTEYFEIDLLLIVLSVLLVIIALASVALYYVWKFVARAFLANRKLKDD